MTTQLTLEAWDRELQSQEPLPPCDVHFEHRDTRSASDELPAPSCRITTGTGLRIEELSEEVRGMVADFFSRNPQTITLVVNSPMNRHYQHPKLRGRWEVLAFRDGGLQDSKDIVPGLCSSIKDSMESVLLSALKDWEV